MIKFYPISIEKFHCLAFLILIFMEQIFVQFIGIQGLSLVLFFIILIFSNNKGISKKHYIYIFFFLIIIFIQYFITPCDRNVNFVLSSILLGALIYSSLVFDIFNLFKHKSLLRFFVLLISLFVIIENIFSISFFGPILGHTENIFLFNEPSHFGLYIMPLLFFLLYKEGINKPNALSLSAPLAFAPSSTFLISFIIYIYTNIRKIFFLILPLVIITFFIFIDNILSFQNVISTNFLDRINSLFSIVASSGVSEGENLSSLVFLNGYSMAYNNLLDSNFIGLGLNQMSCNNEIGFFGNAIMNATDGTMLNEKDGSFLASKLISEFGLVGLFFCIYIFIKCLINLFTISLSKKSLGINMFIILAATIFIFITFFIRSAGGYYNLWMLYIIGFILYERKYRNSFN
jgi:hypothetical protein